MRRPTKLDVTKILLYFLSAIPLYSPLPLSAQVPLGPTNVSISTGPTKLPCSPTVTVNCILNTNALGGVTIGSTELNRGRYNLLNETFPTIGSWVTSGEAVTIAAGIVSMTDTGAGNTIMSLDLTKQPGQPPTDRPFCVEAALTVPNGQKMQFTLVSSFGNFALLTAGGNGNNTVSITSQGVANVNVSPTNWNMNNRFKFLFLVDPTAGTIRNYIYYTDTSTALGRMEQIGAATTWTYTKTTHMSSVVFTTGGAGTGTDTVSAVKVFVPHTLIIGTSIPTGHPGFDPIPSFYSPNVYANSVGYWLEQASGGAIVVLNQGIGSQNINTDLMARYASMILPFKPDWVIIGEGTNDNAANLVTTLANLTTVIDASIAVGAKVLLWDTPPVNSWDATQNIWKNAWNASLPAMCSARPACYLVLTHDALKDPSDATQIYAPFTPDGTHFNVVGYRLMAQLTWDKMVGR